MFKGHYMVFQVNVTSTVLMQYPAGLTGEDT